MKINQFENMFEWLNHLLEIRIQSIKISLENSTEDILRKVYSMEKKLKNTNDLKINFGTKKEIDSDSIGKIYNEFSETDWYKFSDYQFESENSEKSKCRGITSLLSFLMQVTR